MENQQELMYKLQMFEQQMQQIQQQLQAVEQGIIDLSNLNLGLDELVGKKDQEVMSLIGKGIFAKTKLLSEELVVDVGGKKFVTKSIPETKEMIVEQIGKLKEAKEILTENMEKGSAEFQQMIMEAQNAHSCGKEDCACEKGEECEDKENCECEKKSDALEEMVGGEEESDKE
jgi:prefoldin alpha subunit